MTIGRAIYGIFLLFIVSPFTYLIAWMAPLMLLGQAGTPVVVFMVVTLVLAIGGCVVTAFIICESLRAFFPNLYIKYPMVYRIIIYVLTILLFVPIIINWGVKDYLVFN